MTNHKATGAQGLPRPFVMIPAMLIGRVSPTALAVYAAISGYTSARTGTAWPGHSRIAAELRLSRATVIRACTELEKAGVMVVERRFREDGGKTANLYRILEISPVMPVDNEAEDCG